MSQGNSAAALDSICLRTYKMQPPVKEMWAPVCHEASAGI